MAPTHTDTTRSDTVDLSTYDNSFYKPGPAWKRLLWYAVSVLVFETPVPLPSRIKAAVLALFGCEVGLHVTVKPGVKIKYPWFLSIGNNTWLGERCWIDNLAKVTIGSNVCISQGALLLTGNHDYAKKTFDLVVAGITLEDGVWVGARAVVCPGRTMRSHAVLSAGSVLTRDAEVHGVYQGNPAVLVRKRAIGGSPDAR